MTTAPALDLLIRRRWWSSSPVSSTRRDPAHLANPVCEGDLRPGGRMVIVMRASDGIEYPMSATLREVVAPERLAFVAVGGDAEGNARLAAKMLEAWTDPAPVGHGWGSKGFTTTI